MLEQRERSEKDKRSNLNGVLSLMVKTFNRIGNKKKRRKWEGG